jgi:hypothetical protein
MGRNAGKQKRHTMDRMPLVEILLPGLFALAADEARRQ